MSLNEESMVSHRDDSRHPDPIVWRDLKSYGRRPSSFITTYPHFLSFFPPRAQLKGQIRYVTTKRALVGATEPLASEDQSLELLQEFSKSAKREGRRALMLPVSEGFSIKAQSSGFSRVCVGAEPVFVLHQMFGMGMDPLEYLPVSRTLGTRGAVIEELSVQDLTQEMREQISSIIERWKESRRSLELRFLNIVDPLLFHGKKRLFVLRIRGSIQSFLTAVPIPQRSGYFFSDVIRDPLARAGANELLMIEAMRTLHKEGVSEVTLGLCPLAQMEGSGTFERIGRWIFQNWNIGYSFKSLYTFKEKLAPTRWDKLYLISSDPISWSVIWDVIRVHYPQELFRAGRRALTIQVEGLQKKYFTWRPESKFLKARPSIQTRPIWKRIPWTLSLSCMFVILHVLRYLNPDWNRFLPELSYRANHPTLIGTLAGPFFHNHWRHLGGDVLSFLIFGGILECVARRSVFFCATVIGLWLSNPLTQAVLQPILSRFSTDSLQSLLSQVDIGSSNAIYAHVGALAALFLHSRWLWLPFFLNGALFMILLRSWLSFHHILSLAVGYLAVRVWSNFHEFRNSNVR